MNGEIVYNILKSLVEVPSIQSLFIDTFTDMKDYLDFAIKHIYHENTSCVHTNECVRQIFTDIDVDYVELDLTTPLAIHYPSVIDMELRSHIGSLICVNPDEIYYIDYYEEMKRDTKDDRTHGLNFFLFRMTEVQLNNQVHGMMVGSDSERLRVHREFFGCHKNNNREDEELQLVRLNLGMIQERYTSFSEFLDLVNDKYILLDSRISQDINSTINDVITYNLSRMLIDYRNQDMIEYTLRMMLDDGKINAEDWIDELRRRLRIQYNEMKWELSLYLPEVE